MKVALKKVSELQRELDFEVSKDRVSAKLDEVHKELGKVSDQNAREELLRKLVPEVYQEGDVIPDFSSVMLWSPISTRGDRTNEEAFFGRTDHRVSAGG